MGMTRCVVRVVAIMGAMELWFLSSSMLAFAQLDLQSADFERSFQENVRPLLNQYCVECHSGDDAEADIDLSSAQTFAALGGQFEIWQKVREVLRLRQMPPEDAPHPSDREFAQLNEWVYGWLKKEALREAGDPGPVILRRLSNAEYNYTVQDSTGVGSLDPTQEFPVDSAAGEGFTNSGAAQGMSPALMSKYLDAAHEVAQHIVLLPDGIRFSPSTSRRDHSDEHLAMIQDFYRRFTVEGGGMPVDLQGIQFDTNQGGLLPLAPYLQATIEHRVPLLSETQSVEQVAAKVGLNPRYFAKLWQAFTGDAPVDFPSIGLVDLKKKWRGATVADVPVLVAEIEQAQKALWRFHPVGQIGRAGGPASWMEAISPVVASQDLSLPISIPSEGNLVLYLAASDMGDGNSADYVEWQRPRFEFANGHPPILLRDVRGLASQIESMIASEVPSTARYLAAVRELLASAESMESISSSRGLNPSLLKAWTAFVGLGPASRSIHGHLSERLAKVGGYDALHGWGSEQTPSLLANRSDAEITFLTITFPPRSVCVHPSPTLGAVVAWQSPLEGKLKLEGAVADADNHCGNGIHWSVRHNDANGMTILEEGEIDNAHEKEVFSSREMNVRQGDVLSLVVRPRGQDHACDTTRIELNLTEVDGQKRVWNLASDVVDRIQDANPLADTQGNSQVWHFCAEPIDKESHATFPANSVIARWRSAVIQSFPLAEIEHLETSIQQLMTTTNLSSLDKSDGILRQQLLAWNGPLHWLDNVTLKSTETEGEYGLEAATFGSRPDGSVTDASNLCLQAPHVLEVKLPAQLLVDSTFRTTGTLYSPSAATEDSVEGSVQLQVSSAPPQGFSNPWASPIIASRGVSRERLERAFDEFRELFPAALCYTRIVPVDEAVTLTLYHREDNYLQRLMLDEEQRAEIDRLWDQLYFVSQEPLLLTTVFEQISEFATQDRPDLVTAFAPMRKTIYERADAFRLRMLQSESSHLTAILQFASRAWRRPLSAAEQEKLRGFYQELRKAELPHEEAIGLTLARVLTSPAFLYKLESGGDGKQAIPISSWELATRLSYFLWSSLPDERLAESAANNRLIAPIAEPQSTTSTSHTEHEESELLQHTHRLLQDDRIRRLAIEFACQWLNVRDFDQNNDKNEKIFPEFAQRRHDMYEETVRFFEDMFRHNRSILEILHGDRTFVNESMAKHYGIEGITGSEWQETAGMRARGRGGVLGMATILASQSGASRTSPILRGVWISETLLGERLPRPPANVPKLPETVPDGLSSRQMIELHTRQPECAKCHVRIDPYGFALEQFDAVGRTLPAPADTKAFLVDGTLIDGLGGIADYLATARRDEFVRQFSRKLLGFALGREVLLSDEVLLDEMQQSLEQHGFRFRVAVESIVTSPQFLSIRGGSTNP
jgi:AraC-like DNA-binding protein